MNENHDDHGRFAAGEGSGAARAAKAAIGKAHATLAAVGAKITGSRVYQELAVKDRFVRAVPPGSKRDAVVKQAAMWTKAGLEKAAVVAAGGGIVGVAGVTVAAYTEWGGHMTRAYGPAVRDSRAGQRVAAAARGMRDHFSSVKKAA